MLFVDPTRDSVWHWHGSNTPPRMQSLARKSVVAGIRESYLLKRFPQFDNAGPREIFITVMSVTRIIDKGNEPSDFKILVGLMEESDILKFEVNEFLTLRLEDDKTFIYIKGKKFIQCMRLFLQIKPLINYRDFENLSQLSPILFLIIS